MRFVKASALALIAVLLLGGVAYAGVVNVANEASVAQGDTRTFSVTPARSGDTPAYGEETRTSTANGDPLDDFFLVRHAPEGLGTNVPPSSLYLGTGGGFTQSGIDFGTDTSKDPDGDTDKHGCDWGFANQDNRLDLFCAIGLTQASKNELWVQQDNGSFVERSQAFGLRDYSKGRYRYTTFIDVDSDGDQDLYVARYTGSCKCDLNNDGVIDYLGDSWPNELWINTQPTATSTRFVFDGNRADPNSDDGQFNLTRTLGAKKDNVACAQNVDFDLDGDEDLLFCGANRVKLFRNDYDPATQSGGFTDISANKNISGDSQDARLVDLDGNGLYDLVRLNKTSLVVKYDNGVKGGLGPTQTLVGSLTAGETLAFGRFDANLTLDIYALSSRARFKKDQPDRILLNPGTRVISNWVVEDVPAAPTGAGDDVGAVDYDNDGSDEFLVTNGDRKVFGPVQLWDWQAGLP